MSGIHTYGEVVHLFIERQNYHGPFMPRFRKWESNYSPPQTGLQHVDHCVGNVGLGRMNPWVEFYEREGVQHIAMATNNIIETVTDLQKRGVEFLQIPSNYYETLPDRVGHIDEELNALRRLGILVDRDDEGYLLQIFTKPVEDRPTLFFEIIQRKGAKSFGKGNFKALFEAIEREQAARGNL